MCREVAIADIQFIGESDFLPSETEFLGISSRINKIWHRIVEYTTNSLLTEVSPYIDDGDPAVHPDHPRTVRPLRGSHFASRMEYLIKTVPKICETQ